MTKDSHLMYEKYVEARKSKLVNEAASVPGTAAVSAPTQTNSKQMEEQSNSKRIVELLDMLKSDANLATQLALSPEEFAGFIEWAKSKFGGATMGESVVSEKKKAKDEENMEIVKPKSEETEEEYLARRDAAIKASIAAKEESEEQAAMSSHYNTNHEALDLVDHLINHPKKYTKSDAIKILTLASDKLNNKL